MARDEEFAPHVVAGIKVQSTGYWDICHAKAAMVQSQSLTTQLQASEAKAASLAESKGSAATALASAQQRIAELEKVKSVSDSAANTSTARAETAEAKCADMQAKIRRHEYR